MAASHRLRPMLLAMTVYTKWVRVRGVYQR